MKIKRKRKHKGTLMAIGGHEDKSLHSDIIKEIVLKTGSNKLVVSPLGSKIPNEMKKMYRSTFRRAGVKHLHFLDFKHRGDARLKKNIKILQDAGGVFFTGGDQSLITSLIANTPISDAIFNIYHNGGIIAGTSAGASILSEIMMVDEINKKEEDKSNNDFSLSPGLGLLPKKMLIDQHFGQRNRFGRLINVIMKNPEILGVGLDENTAIMVKNGKFKVLGKGLVYIFNGHNIEYTDTKEAAYNIITDVLSHGCKFDLSENKPLIPKDKDTEKK